MQYTAQRAANVITFVYADEAIEMTHYYNLEDQAAVARRKFGIPQTANVIFFRRQLQHESRIDQDVWPAYGELSRCMPMVVYVRTDMPQKMPRLLENEVEKQLSRPAAAAEKKKEKEEENDVRTVDDEEKPRTQTGEKMEKKRKRTQAAGNCQSKSRKYRRVEPKSRKSTPVASTSPSPVRIPSRAASSHRPQSLEPEEEDAYEPPSSSRSYFWHNIGQGRYYMVESAERYRVKCGQCADREIVCRRQKSKYANSCFECRRDNRKCPFVPRAN